MKSKLTFLAVLMIIVSIFAVASAVLADDIIPVNISADTVYVGQAGTILSVEASEGDAIVWYKEVYGVSKGADKIKGATGTAYTLTEEDTSVEGLLIFYATVNGVKSELVKVTVEKAPYTYTKEPKIIRFDKAETIAAHAKNDTNYGKVDPEPVVDSETGKKVLKMTALTKDCHVSFYNLNFSMDDYKIIVYKIKPELSGNVIHVFHGYNDKTAPTPITGVKEGHYGAQIYSGTVADKWQYVIDKAPIHSSWATDFPNGVQIYNGNRFDFYNGPCEAGNYMYLEYIAAFANEQDFNEFKARESAGSSVAEQPDDLDMVAWEFKNDPAFAGEFLDGADVGSDGAKFRAGVKTKTSLLSRNKFELDRYSVVKVLGPTDGTITFYDGETELGAIDLSEGNVADFTDREAFPNWKGEFTDFRIEASVGMTVEAIAFFVNEANANLYTAKAYPCSDCGGIPCICPSKPLEYEHAVWWKFEDTWVTNSVEPKNANVKFVNRTPEGAPAYGSYTATAKAEEEGYFALRYRNTNMKEDHKFSAAENPFIKIGYNYSGDLENTEAYIKFTTDRAENVVVNFNLKDVTEQNADKNGYSVMNINFSSLTAINRVDAEEDVEAEFRGELKSFELGIYNANKGDVLDMAYIVFFEDKGQCDNFNGTMMSPKPEFVFEWIPEKLVGNDYVTIEELDMATETVEFSMSDFSRVSRLTLEELKKYHPNTVINVKGNGYEYKFNTNNIASKFKTWYYDFDAYFEAGFSGDVYREAIKKLVPEDQYVAGIHFVHKFLKNTDFPFVGKMIFAVPEELEGKYLDVCKYNSKTNTLEITERVAVKEGKLAIGTLGGDVAIVNSGYQPTAEEIARAEAYEAYHNTAWDVKMYDFGADGDAKMGYKANNAKVETKTENGVTFKRATSTSTTRIESIFSFTEGFEASEYPVMVIKYKTSANYKAAPANYVSTDFYTSDSSRGYEWYNSSAFYSTGSIYDNSTKWATRIINYTDMDTMKASGLGVSEEWNEAPGSKRSGGQAFPFKGNMLAYRLDFSTGAAGVSVDVAYMAFFKTEEEAKKYVEARTTVEKIADEEAKAADEALNGPKPEYVVFDFLDKNETAKYTLHAGSEAFPVKTETKNTAEGFWSKDADQEYNLTRSLAQEEQFSLKEYPVLKIKAKPSKAGVNCQFYVWQDNQSGNPRTEFAFEKANEWNELILDYSSGTITSGTWDGVLTKYRIDPMRGSAEREITIEYIGFFKSVEAAEAFTSVKDAKAAEKAATKKK